MGSKRPPVTDRGLTDVNLRGANEGLEMDPFVTNDTIHIEMYIPEF